MAQKMIIKCVVPKCVSADVFLNYLLNLNHEYLEGYRIAYDSNDSAHVFLYTTLPQEEVDSIIKKLEKETKK